MAHGWFSEGMLRQVASHFDHPSGSPRRVLGMNTATILDCTVVGRVPNGLDMPYSISLHPASVSFLNMSLTHYHHMDFPRFQHLNLGAFTGKLKHGFADHFGSQYGLRCEPS